MTMTTVAARLRLHHRPATMMMTTMGAARHPRRLAMTMTMAAMTVAAMTVAAMTVAAMTMAAMTMAAMTMAAMMVAAMDEEGSEDR